MEKINDFKNKILDSLYKYRYIILLILLILGILLKLHGSSISLWNSFLTTNVVDNYTLYGKAQTIRSDEWAVTTPLIFSQSFENFPYFSNILRGGSQTDAFSLYGLPVKNIVQIFRPFYLGYLFFDLAHGLSFYWIFRFLALFIVSFEFLMLLTNKNKRLSLIGTFMLSFSPIVQWWFATNGTVELLTSGELAILMLDKYMKNNSLKFRILYLVVMIICGGTFIMVLYPPYQIPMFYAFLAIAIHIIIKNHKEFKFNIKDLISVIAAILIFISLMTYIFIMSKDSILTVINTAYPGNRICKGGKTFEKAICYLSNIFLPYKEAGSPSDESMMFTLFPLGIILTLINIKKNKKIDSLTIALSVPYLIIGIFCLFRIPIYAKLTLLSYSSPRAIFAIGFIDLLLLINAINNNKEPIKWYISLIISLIIGIILVYITRTLKPDYVGWILGLFLIILYTTLSTFSMQYNTKYGKYLFTYLMIISMLAMGFNINPIVKGIDSIYQSPIISAMQDINEKEPGIWLAEAMEFPIPNYSVMAGCPTINATNIYPNLEIWQKLDPDKKYEEIYNRYAHIYVEIVASNDLISEKFKLLTLDKIQIFITPDELKTLGINYIFTVRVMEDYKNENLDFDLIYNENNYHIYKINYLN